jgi:putative tryptophan/tyrosine transport system substrate-binding protein
VRKRRFLGLLVAAAAAPLVSRSQSFARLGILLPQAESDREAQRELDVLRAELRNLGWPDGGRLRIEHRWADAQFSELPRLARELVALKPDVIVCRSTPPTRAVLEETRSIPVVFLVVSDPVGDGIVASLARPAGNATGFTNVESSLGGKWLELLKELSPRMERVGALYNPKTSAGGGTYYLRLVGEAAVVLGVKLLPLIAHDASEIDGAIGALAAQRRAGLLIMPDTTNITHRKPILEAAARYRLPAIYPIPTFTLDGGLISYGVDIVDIYRRGAGYVDQILRGSRPGELPVQAPVKFELTINAKTAKALDIAVPRSLLLRADRVIE